MSYKSQFPEWLSLALSDGRGGANAQPPSIVRGNLRSFILNLSAHEDYDDWTSGAFAAALRASPDAGGSALATWTITVGTPSGGVTPVTFSLAADAQGSIPVDSDGDGVTELLMQVDFTPTGGAANPIIQTRVLVVGDI